MKKVALITGAARRAGAEISKILHQEGFNIVLHYNKSKQDAELLAQRLNTLRKNSAILIQHNLCDTENLDILIKKTIKFYGKIDVLINNASTFYKTPLHYASHHDWNEIINSNLTGHFFLTKAAYPFLRKEKGCIVNITDIHSERPLNQYSIYCIAKAGLVALTKALAIELAPDVRVNAVSPGTLDWPEENDDFDEKEKKKILNSIPMRRAGNFVDIAKAVRFLITDGNYITGHVLNVDGGRSVCL